MGERQRSAFGGQREEGGGLVDRPAWSEIGRRGDKKNFRGCPAWALRKS